VLYKCFRLLRYATLQKGELCVDCVFVDYHKAVQGVYGAGLLLMIVALLIGLIQMLCCCCCKESPSVNSALGSLSLSGGKNHFVIEFYFQQKWEDNAVVFPNLGAMNLF